MHTDASGVFAINPVNDGGYNIMPGMYLQTGSGTFASAHEVAVNYATVNGQFLNMIGLTLNLNEIHASVNTRLYGMNMFVAKDGANSIIADSDVFVMVVLWS